MNVKKKNQTKGTTQPPSGRVKHGLPGKREKGNCLIIQSRHMSTSNFQRGKSIGVRKDIVRCQEFANQY